MTRTRFPFALIGALMSVPLAGAALAGSHDARAQDCQGLHKVHSVVAAPRPALMIAALGTA